MHIKSVEFNANNIFFPLISQAANLQGVKMLCTNAEGASLRGCNFEDPAGIKANLEGEASDLISLDHPSRELVL